MNHDNNTVETFFRLALSFAALGDAVTSQAVDVARGEGSDCNGNALRMVEDWMLDNEADLVDALGVDSDDTHGFMRDLRSF